MAITECSAKGKEEGTRYEEMQKSDSDSDNKQLLQAPTCCLVTPTSVAVLRSPNAEDQHPLLVDGHLTTTRNINVCDCLFPLVFFLSHPPSPPCHRLQIHPPQNLGQNPLRHTLDLHVGVFAIPTLSGRHVPLIPGIFIPAQKPSAELADEFDRVSS